MSEERVIIRADNNVVVQEENITVQVATPGLQGPPGPQGPAGSAGGTTVVHVQSAPSMIWHVNHAFGREPNTVVVIDGEQVIADITYPTPTEVLVSFGSDQTGKVILT